MLGRLLTDYESREIPVEVFAKELLKLISDEEKVRIPIHKEIKKTIALDDISTTKIGKHWGKNF